MSTPVTIRRAATVEDYRACQDAQRRAWGLDEDRDMVPIATLVGANLHGGLVLGAFLPDGSAVGVSFAFLGRIEGRLCLYSQLTGIVPEYQDQGVGGRLKFAQRDIARSEGIGLIAWAFDPLRAGNARFNLDKLGATSRRYIEDMYGPRSDPLNRGVPTGRLIAEWEVDPGPRPAAWDDHPWALPYLVKAAGSGPSYEILTQRVSSDRPGFLLEIPAAISTLRAESPALADCWRLATRQAFLDAFAAGLRAVGFVRGTHKDQERCCYVLRPDVDKEERA
jgi:predicted GNAT superfamily acetyltransferase